MSKYDKTTIILIAGDAGSGKSTTGKIIRQILGCHSYYTPFAAPLKQMAANVLGVSASRFNDYDFKNTHRPLLIALADSYKELYGEEVFALKNVQAILDAENPAGVFVADDIRYPYEYEVMKDTFTNVQLIEVLAPERALKGIGHSSEGADWSFVTDRIVIGNDLPVDLSALTDNLKLVLNLHGLPVLADEFIQELPQS